jgi:UDP-glucose 4-epimerase
MKSLVTGAAGFIGSTLTEKLLNMGQEVLGIDCFTNYYKRSIKEKNISSFISHEKFTLIEENINNLDLKVLLNDIDYIFHQAAQAGVRSSWGDDFEIYTYNNITGTQQLLEAAKESDIKKFIYASSSSVYGDTDKLPMQENNRLHPVSPYGVSKLAGENLCYLYYKNFNVPTVSLRYFTVFGERQRPDMAFHIFIKSILQGKKLTIFGDGQQSRNFTHVQDIVRANILAAKSNVKGEIFNIGGDGKRVKLNEAIDLMEKILDKKAKRNYQKVVKGDVRHTSANTKKAKEMLNYEPEVDFEEGLKREIEYIKKLY